MVPCKAQGLWSAVGCSAQHQALRQQGRAVMIHLSGHAGRSVQEHILFCWVESSGPECAQVYGSISAGPTSCLECTTRNHSCRHESSSL